ncbi:hypothetical protein D3C81_1851950 [compost metagenome]
MATERAAADMAASCAGSDSTSASTAVRLSTVTSSSAMTRAAPASDRARAFRVWWSSMAIFSGISTDGSAATASSEQVEAPARPMTRCALDRRSAMSRKKGATSAAMPASR